MDLNPQPISSRGLSYWLKQTDILFAFALFGAIVLLVFPVSPGLMDALLALSIGLSLLTLLIVVYVQEPSEFSIFPTILLAITLFRLGLNVASTRLILLDGFAGHVIESFGRFVVRGNYVVGAVVFFILALINFIVITKGAGRIAEVSARFTLDALPGKQMAIDAELNAGIIDDVTAKTRRLKVQQEADFYGAMDGASKFVRGDAVAGILITFINIIGGICIGIFQKGYDLVDALEKYTLLSIGDGLVSQVPALIVSVAAGILVTRTGDKQDLGSHISQQMAFYPRSIAIVGVMLAFFAFMPGMPVIPFFSLACLCWWFSHVLKKRKQLLAAQPPIVDEAVSGSKKTTAQQAPSIEKLIRTETFAIHLGYGLLHLIDEKQGGDLRDRVNQLRSNFAQQMGMILPHIAIEDNPELEPTAYQFLIRGHSVAQGHIVANRFLAMATAQSPVFNQGIPTVEPVFGLTAYWVNAQEKQLAEDAGLTVVEGVCVLITHLSEVLKKESHRLLEREDVQKLLDITKEKSPTLISELIPDLVNVGIIQRVLQNLLKEKISIKYLTLILESVADYAAVTKNIDELSEAVRKRLGVYFIADYECEPGQLKALVLDPRLEQVLLSRVKKTQFETTLLLDPQLVQHIFNFLNEAILDMHEQGLLPLVVVTADLRLAFKRFFESSFPRLCVLAYQEIPEQTQLESIRLLALPPVEAPLAAAQ